MLLSAASRVTARHLPGIYEAEELPRHLVPGPETPTPQLHAIKVFNMPTINIQRTSAVVSAAFAVICTVNNNWFQCNVGSLDWRLHYALECFLTALVFGISSSIIYYHNRFGKETADSAEYQNRCLKIGAGIAVAIGLGWPGYQYRCDIVALVSETWGSGGLGDL